ncbi:putative Ig domain-containing protein [Euzebya tangerina]|uniref:putative Ig domain-containing protein n=1 Tax=Euzebya tangerina TaxID=591198 RepID=UPI000E30DFF0|nr:putative Ig domain-containing protein [Euzebya tangerina]
MHAVATALTTKRADGRVFSVRLAAIVVAVLAVIAVVLPTAIPTAGAAERVDGAIALYDFTEGTGSVVGDSSDIGAPLDLTVAAPANTTWGPGGLTVDAATTIQSSGNADKVTDAIEGSGEVTVELWIEPSNTTQDGPARIFSISQSSTKRDLTIGQGLFGSQPTTVFDTRLRTTATNNNGTPSLTTPEGTATTNLQHVVFTRAASGTTTTYVDGAVAAVGSAGGTLGNWASMPLLLGNEVGGSRPWLGRYCLVSVYASALNAAEVDQNYDAGCETVNVPPTANDDDAVVVQDETVTIDVAANDVDSDGSLDLESIAIVDQPSEGTVSVDGGGEVTYTSTGALGDDTFTYTIDDDEGETSNTATVTVTVRAANAAPTIDPIADQTADEGDEIALAVTASDPNSDPLAFSATGLPVDLSIDPDTGAISGTLSQTSAGSYPVEVTADDGLGGTDTESFTFTVNPVNVAPTIVPIAGQQVATGAFELQVVATDADGDAVTFAAAGLPDDLAIDASSGLITGTAATPGTSTVTITASDPTDGEATETFDLTILAVDVSPVVEYRFDDGSGTTVADSSGVGTPLDLTIQQPANTTWLPSGLSVDAATTISSGGAATKVTDAVGATGEVTVDLYIQAVPQNQFGPARILSISNSSTTRNLTVGQGGGRSKDPQTTLDVRLRSTATSVNGTPSLTSPANAVTGDPQHVTFTRDADGNTELLVDGAVVATGNAGGSLANWASTMPLLLGNESGSNRPWLGIYCYAAIYDEVHTQAELALRQDGCSATDDNASPVVDPIADQTNDPGDVVSLTATATDADGDPVTFSATGLPADLDIDSTGLISGTVAPDAGGTYPVTVTATDPDGASGSTSFTWTITIPNVPPTAVDDDAAVVTGGSIDIDVAANDSDPDGTLDLASVQVVTPPSAGTTTVTPGGQITYTSTGGPGSDSFTYQIADDDGDFSGEATVTVTVLAENSPPTITPVGDQTNDEGQTIALPVEADDVDDNTLAFSATGLPDALSINSETGVISGDLSQTSAGVYPVEVTVDDGVGGTASDTFTWTVQAVDVAPIIDGIADQQDQVGDVVSVTATASDEDGDTIEFAAAGLPDGLAIDAGTGVISGEITAAPDTYAVTVTATDPGGNFDETTFEWTVLEQDLRVDGSVVLYEFEDGAGAGVADTSGNGSPLDLTIDNPANVTWTPGALALNASVSVASAGPATKVSDAVTASNEVTVETWIIPENTTQSGPARIVSLSESPFARNVTLGQGTFGNAPTDTFDLRLRSTAVGDNGTPSTTTPAGTASTDLSHVVATRDASGATTIYVDGQVVQTSTVGGDLSNWTAMPLILGNEASGDRPWLGTMCLTAIYDSALSAAEVTQNYEAGCEIASSASALLTVSDGSNDIDASTFSAGSFEFTNTSTPGVELTAFSLDLSTAIFNDVVFDPDGDAGDVGSKCFEPDAAQATATGLQEPNGGTPPNCDNSMFAGPHEGGFDVLNLTFDDFDPGEALSFSVDNDPTSIQGVPITGNSGAISGLELIGSTVTMTFVDPNGNTTNLTGRLFAQDAADANGVGDGASQLILDQAAAVPGALDLAVDGVTLNPTGFSSGATAAVVPDATQQVTLAGPAGADVRLMVVEASYDEPEGFDKELFEANRADAIAVYDATLDGAGTATIEVALPNAVTTHDANNGDLYQLIAAVSDTPRYAGASNIVILELDPSAAPASPVIAPIGTVNLTIDQAGQIPVSATDANGDPITLSISSTPDITALGATFTQPNPGVGQGVIEWTPAATDIGTYEVTVTASDPTAEPDATATFTLNVVEEAISGGSADVAIAPGGGIDASTFGGGFEVTNTSTGGQTIQSVTYDLSTAILPDMVFDPVGQAGDATAKCLEPSAGVAATGYVVPSDNCVDPFSQPHNGTDGDEGFDAVTAAFTDFGSGETFAFAVDVDPTSIKDVGGAGNAGSVSGLELAGSTVTVAFSDGSVVVETFQTGTSPADSSVTAASDTRSAVTLAVDGVTLTPQPDLSDSHSAAAVADAAQTIVVTGPADTDVRLLRLESALVQTPSYDPDPFEANKAIAVQTIDVTLDGAGTASVPVTLTDAVTGGVATDDTGLNYFAAVVGQGTLTGPLSNVVVLDLDPTLDPSPDAVDDQVSAEPGSSTVIDVLANDTSSVGLDPSTVTVTSGPTGGTVVGPDAAGALTYNAEQGFDDNDGDSFTYTVADTDGNVSNEATVTITDSTAGVTVVHRINAGGPAYTDSEGNEWSADTGFVGGQTFAKPNEPISGTNDPTLYQTERYGNPFAYELAVANGTVEVDLHLAEIYFGAATTPNAAGAAGARVFSATAEGQPIVTDLDLFAEDGAGVARIETISVQVTDGVLNLDFASTADNAKVSAIEVRQIDGQPPTGGQVFARINAGGPETANPGGGPAWEADVNPDGHPFLTDGGSNGNNGFAAVEPGPTVPAGVPGVVFDTERWSNSGFSYGIPVPAGTQVFVRLFLGNGFPGTSAVGDRVYDVSIDGAVVEDDLDLVATFGNEVGGMLEYLVTSDGSIDIAFSNEVENPLVNAIEVVSADSSPGVLGAAPATLDFGQVLIDGSATEDLTVTNLGFETGDPAITITDAQISGGEFSTDLPAGGLTLAPGASDTIGVTFAPTAAGPQSATLSVVHDGTNTPVEVALGGIGSSDIPVTFSSSGLAGESLNNPTSLEFGPDDRLYVSQQNGLINAYTVVRNGPDDYDVTATEAITDVQQIVNHNDDGSVNSGVNTRQVTGLMTAGTAANPVLYVTSSDPRIGAGGGGNDSGLDTNSGVISRLTWNGTDWDHVQLVRGLPRSEENHATNGLDLDPTTNTLYVMSGGHANKGAPSNNFAGTSEYFLSAALLSVDLDALDALAPQVDSEGQTYLYNLPTLVDPSRDDSTSDPFGGNNGLNQAITYAGEPVQVYSPGYRNAYDVVFTASGELYTSDNGPNTNWGGQPLIYDSTGTLKGHEGQAGVDFDAAAGDYCTNEFNEGGSQGHGDPLFHITGDGFYGGHPTPIRAFPSEAGVYVYEEIGGNWTETAFHTFSELLPAGLTLADFPDNPIECDYQADDPGLYLDIINSSTNGIAEYTASNFGGGMQGNLLTASFNGNINRYELNAAGTDTVADEVIFSGFGSTPLDVTTLGDDGPFPGTVWAATYGADNITVFEPGDYDGTTGGNCTGADDPALDEDNDGFSNADEIAAGTDPCSGGSLPTDADGDFISDVTDPDDDNDGVDDTVDPFAIDATNGIGATLPLLYPLENNDPATGFFGLGFTGLMTNGTDTWIDQFDEGNLAAGGAVGALTVEQVPAGDAFTDTNTQEYAFQFGVDVDGSTDPFIIHSQLESPFFTTGGTSQTPTNFQSNGIFIGNGSQDDYLKLVFGGGSGIARTQVLLETGGTVDTDLTFDTAVTGDFVAANAVDLYLEVDPAAGTVQARISIDGGTTITDLGTPVAIPAAWLDGADAFGMAVGIISTSNGPGPEFAATWDFINIEPVVAGNTDPVLSADDENPTIVEGDTAVVTVTASDVDGDTVALSANDVPAFGSFDDTTGELTLSPQAGDAAGSPYDITISGDDGNGGSDSVLIQVTVVEPATNDPLDVELFAYGDALYRVNAGGPQLPAADGGVPWGEDQVAAGAGGTAGTGTQSPQLDPAYAALPDADKKAFGTADPITIDGAVPAGVPEALFQLERWDPPASLELGYDFDVPAGELVEVRVYLAEVFQEGTPTTPRVFDIQVDGATRAAGIEPLADFGHDVGFVVPILVTSDGTVDVDFLRQSENPAVKGIEIVELVTARDAEPGADVAFLTTVTNPSSNSADATLTALDVSADGGAATDVLAACGPAGGTPLVPGDAVECRFTEPVSGSPGDVPSVEVTATYDVTGGAVGELSTSNSVDVTLVDPAPPQTVRINAAGPTVASTDLGPDWEADDGPAHPTLSVASGSSLGSFPVAGRDAGLPAYVPQDVFQTERWDGTNDAAPDDLTYAIPVAVGGDATVNLFMANGWSGTNDPGERQFDVLIEGVVVLDEFDLSATYGHQVGGMETFAVTDTDADGLVTIVFEHGTGPQNPLVNAIEVIPDVGTT